MVGIERGPEQQLTGREHREARMSENTIGMDNEELNHACRWNAFVVYLHANYSYLLNLDLAMQIAREAQEHFEEEP